VNDPVIKRIEPLHRAIGETPRLRIALHPFQIERLRTNDAGQRDRVLIAPWLGLHRDVFLAGIGEGDVELVDGLLVGLAVIERKAEDVLFGQGIIGRSRYRPTVQRQRAVAGFRHPAVAGRQDPADHVLRFVVETKPSR
jgi:hypothetical protein